MKVRGIRGAITVDENKDADIFSATKRLMEQIIERNGLHHEDVASAFLTMTPDLDASFPAKAVRSIEGWQWVPLMCAVELSIAGSLPRCIRILLHVNTDLSQSEVVHVYLDGATVLRPDLVAD